MQLNPVLKKKIRISGSLSMNKIAKIGQDSPWFISLFPRVVPEILKS